MKQDSWILNGFVCTYRGLKLVYKNNEHITRMCFVCTYRGLKLHLKAFLCMIFVSVLFVPIGDWNYFKSGRSFLVVMVLFVPIGDWNYSRTQWVADLHLGFVCTYRGLKPYNFMHFFCMHKSFVCTYRGLKLYILVCPLIVYSQFCLYL